MKNNYSLIHFKTIIHQSLMKVEGREYRENVEDRDIKVDCLCLQANSWPTISGLPLRRSEPAQGKWFTHTIQLCKP